MRVFISHTSRDRDLASRIASQLALRGYEVSNPISEQIGSEHLAKIFSDVRSSDLFLALLSAPTPNVYYELGIAVGAGLPVLIASPPSGMAADIAMLPCVQLTGNVEADAQFVVSALPRLDLVASRRLTSFDSAEDELRAALKDTSALESLTPKRFEFLLVEFFKSHGCGVELASEENDLGFDFSLNNRDGLFLVEVKKMIRQTRIAVDAVRTLVGSVRYRGARGGILISASGFTSAAREFALNTPVSLRTLDDVLAAKVLGDLWHEEGTHRGPLLTKPGV